MELSNGIWVPRSRACIYRSIRVLVYSRVYVYCRPSATYFLVVKESIAFTTNKYTKIKCLIYIEVLYS